MPLMDTTNDIMDTDELLMDCQRPLTVLIVLTNG